MLDIKVKSSEVYASVSVTFRVCDCGTSSHSPFSMRRASLIVGTGGQRIKKTPLVDQTLSFLARFSGPGFVDFLMSVLYNLLSGQPRPRLSRRPRLSIDGRHRLDGRSRLDSHGRLVETAARSLAVADVDDDARALRLVARRRLGRVALQEARRDGDQHADRDMRKGTHSRAPPPAPSPGSCQDV